MIDFNIYDSQVMQEHRITLFSPLLTLSPHSLISLTPNFPKMSNTNTTKEPTTPPPVIGKIGPYTVFLTPPSPSPSPTTISTPSAVVDSPKNVTLHAPPPPVQPPPAQFHEHSVDRFGFLRDYFTKVQTWHESIDGFMANWLGLNQSKFQWALDDYYEANAMGKGDMTKEVSNKRQTV